MHILMRRSSSRSTSQALAWHTTSRSRGRTNRERSQNVVGSGAWVGICVGAGYAFGNVPIVRDNFSLVALGIVFVSILPMMVEFLKLRRSRG